MEMAYLTQVSSVMTATVPMVMGAAPPVRSKQAGSVQLQDSCAYRVAPMPVMRDK